MTMTRSEKLAATKAKKAELAIIAAKAAKIQARKNAVNEITIRSQKVSHKFQRFMVVVGMLHEGHSRVDIVDRLMSENGIYAGTDKAMSEKSTKNFVGKVTACYNGLTGAGKPGKVSHEMTRLDNGLDVTSDCTFKSYARLTYKAYQAN